MPIPPSIEAALGHVVALVAAGMGVAFFVADWRSSNSRVLAAFLVGMGLAIWATSGFQAYRDADSLPLWVKLSRIPVAFTVIAGAQWLLGIRRTIPAANLRTSFGDVLIRCAQGAALVYGAMTLVLWRQRADWLMFRLGTTEALRQPVFLVFALPFFSAVAISATVTLLTLNRKPDWPEKIRLIALVVALPFLASGFVVRPETAAYGTVIGLMIFLVGALEYHVAQGHRGQFMSRFLAPQVADLVRRHGLEQTIRDQKCEISAVYCDIRGFTPYAERQETEKVIGLLRKYYDAVGTAATEVGGTIKDYAGDGVLILIGAPLAYPDRAARALKLAETLIRETPIDARTERRLEGRPRPRRRHRQRSGLGRRGRRRATRIRRRRISGKPRRAPVPGRGPRTSLARSANARALGRRSAIDGRGSSDVERLRGARAGLRLRVTGVPALPLSRRTTGPRSCRYSEFISQGVFHRSLSIGQESSATFHSNRVRWACLPAKALVPALIYLAASHSIGRRERAWQSFCRQSA
jgi:adenylate cyclase